MATKITMEDIHRTGAARHPERWLAANETAIHAAVRLGVNHTILTNKLLLSLVSLHILETFFNPKSPHAARVVKFVPEHKQELTDKLRTLILMGCKQAGSCKPLEALLSVEESMTFSEFEAAKLFLRWVTDNKKTFGHGNIGSVWNEHQDSLKKKKGKA
jgi:hypothetical protein